MIEKIGFSADIEHFSASLKVKFEKAIAEAVVNSIQANASNVEVSLNLSKNLDLISLQVVDDGEGFITENLKSFFTLHSSNKKDLGGKGIGRVTWFKFFEQVSVESVFQEGETWTHIRFILTKGDRKDVEIHRTVLSEPSTQKTSILLKGYFPNDSLRISPILIKDYLVREMLILLYAEIKKDKKFCINIKKTISERVEENETITPSDIPASEKEIPFSITHEDENFSFTLHCIRIDTTSSNNVVTGFVAGGRTVSSFRDVFSLDIHAPMNRRTGQYWLLLESSMFNDVRFMSDDRERITISDYSEEGSISLNECIKNALVEAISQYFDEIAPDHQKERELILNDIAEYYPQYALPQYQNIFKRLMMDRVGRLDKNYFLNKLHEFDFKKEKNLKEELKQLLTSKVVDKDITQKTLAISQKTNMQAKEVLVDYMWYRHAVIEQLQKFIDDNEKSEDLIHSLFCQRYTTQTIPSQMNCIWLLDDKFMQFTYMASEGVMNSVIKDIYSEQELEFHANKRMDLFILFDREENISQKDCVIIEFKSFSAKTDEKSNAVTQVLTKYANTLRKYAGNINTVYAYIITTVDEELKENLKALDFNQAFSQYGDVFYSYSKNTATFVNYISASTLVGDAKDRHDFFFKMLKEELSSKQRAGDINHKGQIEHLPLKHF